MSTLEEAIDILSQLTSTTTMDAQVSQRLCVELDELFNLHNQLPDIDE